MQANRFLLALAVAFAAGLLPACETPPDPREGPTADVSTIPWSRPEPWESNPYGSTFQGTR